MIKALCNDAWCFFNAKNNNKISNAVNRLPFLYHFPDVGKMVVQFRYDI